MEGVDGVSGEPGDGFCDDHVDIVVEAVVDHPHEVGPRVGFGARDGFAGVDSDHGPLRVLADVVPVILELGVVGAYLLLAIGGHPAVCGHPQLGVLLFVSAV